jgi:TldD protein
MGNRTNSTLAAGAEAAAKLARCAAANTDANADYFEQSAASTLIVIDDGRIEELTQPITVGGALRLVLPGHGPGPDHAGGQSGQTLFGHLGAPSPAEIKKLGDDLLRLSGHPSTANAANAAGTATAPFSIGALRKHYTPVATPFTGRTLEEKVALCREAERIARALDPRVVQVRVAYRDGVNRIAIARGGDGCADPVEQTTHGVYLSVMVTARAGDVVQTGYEAAGCTGGWELFEERPVEQLARCAAERAVRMLTAARPRGGVMPVVLSSSAGGTMIHEAVGHGLEADLVRDGLSTYEGQIGQLIASPLITVIDDPTLPGKYGSYIFDDEGVKASPTVLVEKGVLKGWLNSLDTAADFGHAPSGNGRRESYRHLPIPRMSNTYIAAGTDDPEAIIRDTHTGLYVTRMGGGEVNSTNGDFVFEVSEGFLIENGKIGEPVRGCTLAGNGPKVLTEIDRVGSDLGFGIGTCGKDGQGVPVSDAQPTLRIPKLTVGGMV